MGREMRSLRRMEQHGRGSCRKRRAERHHIARRPPRRSRRIGRPRHTSGPAGERPGRDRPGSRRRFGAGLGGADRRRSRHRQIDPLAPGGGAPQQGRWLCLHLRRRGRRPGAHAGRPPGRQRGAGGPRRQYQCTRYPGHLGRARRAFGGGHRFDPDHVCGQFGFRPRHGGTGPRFGSGTDPLSEKTRHRAIIGRPCHQGRHHRRAAGARTHG